MKVAFFVLGVFLHNLLEGLALGVQTNKSSAISLFTAIMLHGFPLATAVTTTLLNHWMPLGLTVSTMTIYLAAICSVRPFGIMLGFLMLQIPSLLAAQLIAAFLQVTSTKIM